MTNDKRADRLWVAALRTRWATINADTRRLILDACEAAGRGGADWASDFTNSLGNIASDILDVAMKDAVVDKASPPDLPPIGSLWRHPSRGVGDVMGGDMKPKPRVEVAWTLRDDEEFDEAQWAAILPDLTQIKEEP